MSSRVITIFLKNKIQIWIKSNSYHISTDTFFVFNFFLLSIKYINQCDYDKKNLGDAIRIGLFLIGWFRLK